MQKIEIRVLSEFDAETYFPLRLRALKEEPESFGGAYEEESQKLLTEVASSLKSNENFFVLGAFCPELVGVVGFFRRKGVKMRHKGTIWGMYVKPEHQGKGIGKALLQEAIIRAAALSDIEYLLLAVVNTNEAARNLYLSLGFTVYGLERKVLKLGNKYVDEELMSLELHTGAI